MPTVYVLLCEKNRYYVGKTDRSIEDRIEEHFNKCGSEWTRKYKPIKAVEIKKEADEFDEDKYTKMYMKKYGIDKVRGGTYTQIELPEYQEMTLQNELCSASDLCFRCNRSGHFASNCYAKTKADGSPIDYDSSDDESENEECWCCEYCDKEFSSKHEANQHENICKNKNKKSSFIPKFFDTALAVLKVAEELIDDKPKRSSNYYDNKPKKQTCFRCGRDGHYANNCYASTHVNGKKIY
jgi:predicted GIY-YIG superfamily endonuclease